MSADEAEGLAEFVDAVRAQVPPSSGIEPNWRERTNQERNPTPDSDAAGLVSKAEEERDLAKKEVKEARKAMDNLGAELRKAERRNKVLGGELRKLKNQGDPPSCLFYPVANRELRGPSVALG